MTESSAAPEDGPWRAGDDDPLILAEGVAIDAEARAELRRVAASDPMIAIVSPRFGDPAIGARLPPATYVSLPDDRCLHVKASVLRDFPPPTGPMNWDRYALALNRYGFRCAIANHATASAPGTAPDLAARARALDADFPGIAAAAAAFLAAAPREAERLLAALAPAGGRLTIAFDGTQLGPTHSGTSELAATLISLAAAGWGERYDTAVVASEATYAFHFGGRAQPPRRVTPESREVFAAFVRIGQPFHWKEMEQAVRRAPALVFFLLDTIGLDCLRMAPDDLDGLWRFTLAEADGLLFNSAFTRRQFERRFGPLRPGLPARASLHAVAVAASSPPGAGTVLIIGNAFPHKHVLETARLLAERCPSREIVALGLEPGRVRGVTGLRSGGLDAASLDALYARAGVVVYPSVYEGFGFPVIEALTKGRPVILRRLPPFLEIAACLGDEANLHWFETEDDLVRLVSSDLRWQPPVEASRRGWPDALADLRDVVDASIDGIDYSRVLRRIDFMRGRMAWARARRFDADALGDEAGRLAGAAGRLAQAATLRLAATPLGRTLLRLSRRPPR